MCLSVTRLDLRQTRYREAKGMGIDVKVQVTIFVEHTGAIMGLHIPMLVIDRRGVSIMSGVFPYRRLARLRVYDA